MRHRAISMLGSLIVLLAPLAWIVLDTTHAEAAVPPAVTQTESSRYVAADPLPAYTFVPPTATTGQPVRLLVVLHGMGGSGGSSSPRPNTTTAIPKRAAATTTAISR